MAFNPVGHDDASLFWSSGHAWGTARFNGTEMVVRVIGGQFDIDRVTFRGRDVTWHVE